MINNTPERLLIKVNIASCDLPRITIRWFLQTSLEDFTKKSNPTKGY
jgi:hypothetical protein